MPASSEQPIIEKKYFQQRVTATDRLERLIRSPGHHLGMCFILLIVIGLGILMVLWGSNSIPRPEGYNVPDIVAISIGILFGGACLLGLLGHLRKLLFRKTSRAFIGKAWSECSWDPSGSVSGKSVLSIIVTGIMVTILIGAFSVPFVYSGFISDRSIPFMVAGTIVGLITFFCFLVTIYLALRASKYGTSRLHYTRFPYFLDEPLELAFSCQKGIPAINCLTITLRCIERYQVTTGSSKNRRTVVLFDALCEHSLIYNQLQRLDPEQQLALTIDLPESALPTNLRAGRPRWWELNIKADTLGLDYEASFHLPIYARPAKT